MKGWLEPAKTDSKQICRVRKGMKNLPAKPENMPAKPVMSSNAGGVLSVWSPLGSSGAGEHL